MIYTLQPWQFLFAVFCGWVHQRQTEIIEFQNDQITTLICTLVNRGSAMKPQELFLSGQRQKNCDNQIDNSIFSS